MIRRSFRLAGTLPTPALSSAPISPFGGPLSSVRADSDTYSHVTASNTYEIYGKRAFGVPSCHPGPMPGPKALIPTALPSSPLSPLAPGASLYLSRVRHIHISATQNQQNQPEEGRTGSGDQAASTT
jgi:hypothetical protein